MTRFIQVLSVLLLSHFNVVSQTFNGSIKDQHTGSPIPFSSIYILDLEIGIIADSAGNFNAKNSLPSQIKAKFSATGYESKVLTIQLPATNFVVLLEERHLEFDEIIVSNNQGAKQQSNSIHIETRKLSDLNTIPATNLGEAMSNIPGVYSSSTGTGISKPVIRGSQGIRVVTLLNGLRIENQQWGGDHGMGMTELGIGSVEVIKGPSSLLYGADALGGVVYFIDEPYAGANTHELNLKTQFESVSLGTKNQLMYKVARQNYRLSVGGLFTDHADYQLPSGQYAQNSRFSDRSAKLAFGTNKKNWAMHIRYNFSNTRAGIPGHTHDSIANPADFQVDEQSRQRAIPAQVFFNHFLSIENKFFFKRHVLTFLGGQTFNRLREFEEKFTIPGISADLYNSVYSLKLKSQLTENFSLVTGYQGMVQYNVNDSKAEEQLIPDALTIDNGIFSIAYLEKGKWNWQGGLRFDIRSLESLSAFKGIEPIKRNFNGLNYSLGVVRSGEKHTVRLNMSSGYRAPHLSELLANGFHHGALRYEIGSTELTSEKANQIDFTYEYHGEHLSIVVNPFASLLNDYIYLEPKDTLIESLPVYAYKQIDKAYTYGLDFGWHYHPHFAHWLHLENSFSHVTIEGREGFNLALIPQTRISTLLKASFNMKTKVRLEQFTVQHTYYFKQDQIAAFETPSPAYQVVNIGAQGKITGKFPLEIKVGVKNLLNAKYIDHLSRLKNIDLPFPGRNYYISLNYQLTFKSTSNEKVN
jgi:iron complex outermembrane receptor protein